MGSYSLEVQLLKRVPARFKKNPEKIYGRIPDGLLQACGPVPPDDPWHVKLKTVSRYCSMDELKAYLAAKHPELDLSGGWSMTGGTAWNRDVRISAGEQSLIIPRAAYETLETDHVVTDFYYNFETSWCMDGIYYDSNWIKGLVPVYLSPKVLRDLASARTTWAVAHAGDAACAMSDGYYSRKDVLGFLIDAYAVARSKNCAAWAFMTD